MNLYYLKLGLVGALCSLWDASALGMQNCGENPRPTGLALFGAITGVQIIRQVLPGVWDQELPAGRTDRAEIDLLQVAIEGLPGEGEQDFVITNALSWEGDDLNIETGEPVGQPMELMGLSETLQNQAMDSVLEEEGCFPRAAVSDTDFTKDLSDIV